MRHYKIAVKTEGKLTYLARSEVHPEFTYFTMFETSAAKFIMAETAMQYYNDHCIKKNLIIDPGKVIIFLGK